MNCKVGLHRKRPLTATTGLTRRQCPARTGEHLVRARSGGVCEICGKRKATRWHYRKDTADGGVRTAANGLDLCSFCRQNVTTSCTEYYLLGWCVHRGTDPELVPVQLWHGQYVLDNNGDLTATDHDLDEAS